LRPRSCLARSSTGISRGRSTAGTWFRGNLRELFADTLLSPASLQRGYFQPAFVRRIVDEHLAGTRDHTLRLWQARRLREVAAAVTSIPFHSPHPRFPARGGAVVLRNFRAVFQNSAGTSFAQLRSVKSSIPIAIVMTSFEPGGTERQMTELLRRLDPTRWEVHLACFEAKGPWFERAAEHAVSVAEFPVRGFGRPDVLRLHLELRELVPQPAHRAGAGDRNLLEHLRVARGRAGRRAGAHRQPPWLEHGSDPGLVALQRLAYACATKVVANSPRFCRSAAARARAEAPYRSRPERPRRRAVCAATCSGGSAEGRGGRQSPAPQGTPTC